VTFSPPPRRPLTLSVKLEVALRALGVKESDIDWSHEPALQLRAINEAGTDYDPPQHDPGFIFIRRRAEHDRITFKDNGTGRGDLTAIAHSKRVTKEHEEFRRRILAKDAGEPRPERRGHGLRSRGFDKSLSKKFSGKVVPRRERRRT
jgi:hypothetical protein